MGEIIDTVIQIIIIWMVLETLNYFYYVYLLKKSSKKIYHKTNVQINNLIPSKYYYTKHFIDTLTYYFCHKDERQVRVQELHRNNVKKIILYLSLGKTLRDINDSEDQEIERMINRIETVHGVKFRPGINKSVYCMRPGSIGLNPKPRPLIMYVGLRFIRYYMELLLSWRGYTNIRINGFVFFYPRHIDRTKPNLILNHGYGLGAYPYIRLIDKFSRHYNIIIANYPNISNLYFHNYFSDSPDQMFPSVDIVRETYINLLDYLDIKMTDIMSHSAGSLISGVLDNSETFCRKIRNRILVEPVSFFHCIGKVFNVANTVLKNNSTFVHGFILNDIHVQYFQAKWDGWREMIDVNRDIEKKQRFNYRVVILNRNDSFSDYDTIVKEYGFCIDKILTIEGMKHGDIVFSDLSIFDDMLRYLGNI